MKNLIRGGVCTLILSLSLATAAMAQKNEEVVFGVPSWPGVTVKSEVVAQLLQSMGYDVKQMVASPSIIFSSLSNDGMQVFLGGWSPLQDPMIAPLVEKKKIIKAGVNIRGAVTALAVPTYVAEAGVTSVEDLAKHKDKFKKTIFSIETGTGWSDTLHKAKDADAAGLGDWKLMETPTAIMITEALGHVKRNEWVVFYGWEPHWMNVSMDLVFLDSKTEATAGIGASESIVYSITSAALPQSQPQVFKVMEQLRVPNQVQSGWIFEYKRNRRAPKEVAEEWIAANIDGLVAEWMEGVKAKDGRPAIEVIRAAYK